MAEEIHDRAKYHAMIDGTAEDWQTIVKHVAPFQKDLPNRIVTHLNLLKGECGGFAVDRLEHCLQTATRAHQAGEDEEYVVCALVHDIGDTLGPANHADVAAAVILISKRPRSSVTSTIRTRSTPPSSRCRSRHSSR